MLTLWSVLKVLLWTLLGGVALFFGHAAVTGFLEGLGIKRRPKFRVIVVDDDQEEAN